MAPLLDVDNLTWTPPGEDRAVFRGVRLTVDAGELVTLRGRSGSGKSTLLRCIIGLEKPDRGEIRWRGDAVSGDAFLAFRNHVRYVQQRPSRVADSIREDLEFARRIARERGNEPPDAESRQREYLEKLGLGDLSWSRDFDELSVGEQQRIALVRSLTSQPHVLLLDEPTSALDPGRVEDVEALVKTYLGEKPDERAVLWVTHLTEQVDRLDGRRVDLDALNRGAEPVGEEPGDD
jgi:ABC-type iron transport system FetAB ATPase subunit